MVDYIDFFMAHWFLSSLFVLTALLLILQEWQSRTQSPKEFTPQELTQWMNHQNAALIDVRDPSEFATGHIVGAVSVPLSQLEQSLHKLPPKDKPIITVCARGIRSAQAATKLKTLGYTQVFSLANGLQSWKSEQLPLVKE